MLIIGIILSKVIVSVSVAVLPKVSRAVTVTKLLPVCKLSKEAATDQLEVPVVVPDPPRLLVQLTLETLLVSLAVPESVKEVEEALVVAAAVGEVMVTAGAVLSKATVKVSVAVLPAASCATTEITLLPDSRVMPLAVQLAVPSAVPVAVEPLTRDQVTEVTRRLSVEVPVKVIDVEDEL